eukprot:scaffold5048_cov338-Prasinococcus_capsulatus_cf.AAC.9
MDPPQAAQQPRRGYASFTRRRRWVLVGHCTGGDHQAEGEADVPLCLAHACCRCSCALPVLLCAARRSLTGFPPRRWPCVRPTSARASILYCALLGGCCTGTAIAPRQRSERLRPCSLHSSTCSRTRAAARRPG